MKTRTPILRLLLAATLLVAAPALAQPGVKPLPAPARTHQLVPEDYFSIATIIDFVPAPDGKRTAYVELRWDKAGDRRTADLWVVEHTSGKRTRLTFDPAFDLTPAWAPDGKSIYFRSARRRSGEKEPPHDGRPQVWRVGLDGGAAIPVTRIRGGVAGFELSKSGDAIYYLKRKQRVGDEFKALRQRFSKLEYGHGVEACHEVWKIDLESWRPEKLIDTDRFVRSFAVAPDESKIAMITDPTQHLVTHEGWSRVDVLCTKSGETATLPDKLWRADAPSPFGWLSGFAWSADSKALAFDVAFDGYPSELFVAEWPEQGTPAVWKIDRPDQAHVESERYVWQGTTRNLCFVAEHRAGARVYCVTQVTGGGQGRHHVVTPEEAVVSQFAFAENGNALIAGWSTHSNPGDLYRVAAGKVQQLTRINPQVDTWKLPQIRKVNWPGANGDIVEGILELPPDYQPGKPLPTVIELHGGPTSATKFELRFWIYGRALFAARGYALLSPNYRGSVGYGDKFLSDLIGRENDIEVEDILKGVDWLVGQGIADPDRLGVMGWSNGGYLTNALITKSDRFKAASSGAGVFDMTLQWAEEDTPGHVVNFMRGKLPWEDPAHYQKGSPVYFMQGCKTPTIVHVGAGDARVPLGHSRGLYRALRHYLKVPTELVMYPGAGHGLATYQHRLAKMLWDQAWFDKYLPVE